MSRSIRQRLARSGPALGIFVVAAIALGARCTGLDLRPLHGDEANQAYKTGKLLETGKYVYDPHDHHGPTLYYLALIPIKASGVRTMADIETWMLRIVPVAFSIATLLLLIPLGRALPPGAGLCTALLLAISPAFTFYSRYYIQESLLVFFTFAAILFGWRYTRRASVWNAIGLIVSLALMHATKETAVLAYAAMGFALAVTLIWRFGPREAVERARDTLKPGRLIIAFIISVALSVTLFSAFGTNWRGPLDSILTYSSYFKRAGGAGMHDKPWNYYLSILWYVHRGPGPVWSEAVVLLLGALGLLVAFWRLPRVPQVVNMRGDAWFLRFIAVYTTVLTILYSAVPYKTPWTLLSFYSGITLLAGAAVARGVALAPRGWRRGAVIVAFGIALTHLGAQTWRTETEYNADVRNPWVYAHTSSNLLELVKRVDEFAAVDGGLDMSIKVIQPDNDYWPLPWYLRKYKNVGYWSSIPPDAEADLIITTPRLDGDLRKALKGAYFGPSMYSLRPAVLRALYVRQEIWDTFMAARSAAGV